MGTPPVGAAYTAAGGLAVVEEAGIGRIREHNRGLADDLRRRLMDAGLTLHEARDPEDRSALVLARHPDPQAAVGWLASNDVVIDCRGPFIRFSPHFYNTIGDNERAVEVLKRFR
jgi:selenocysteine lyase/cysteine desulfurase